MATNPLAAKSSANEVSIPNQPVQSTTARSSAQLMTAAVSRSLNGGSFSSSHAPPLLLTRNKDVPPDDDRGQFSAHSPVAASAGSSKTTAADAATLCSPRRQDSGGRSALATTADSDVDDGSGSDVESTLCTIEHLPTDFSLGILWYATSDTEGQFLEYQMTHGGVRFFWFCVVAGLLATIIAPFSKSTLQYTLVLFWAVIPTAGAVLDGLTFRAHRLQKEQHEKDYRAETEQHIFTSAKHSRLLIPPNDKCIALARRHEIICASVWAFLVVETAVTYSLVQSECNHISGSRSTNCINRLYQFFFFILLLPLMIGGCRLLFMIPPFLINFVLVLSLVRFHNTSTTGTVIIYLIDGIFLCFVAVAKWFDEQQRRSSFEVEVELVQQIEQLECANMALNEFVRSIVPKRFQNRLFALSSPVADAPNHSIGLSAATMDVSPSAVCIVVDLHDVVGFMNSILPVQGAVEIGLLNIGLYEMAAEVGIDHIRTVGDVNIFVGGLLSDGSQDHSDRREAMAPQIQEQQQHLLRAAHFANNMVNSDAVVPMRCSIVVGPLVGFTIGTHCVRYDVIGPAMSMAYNGTVHCPPKGCVVDEATCVSLSQFCAFEELPLEDISESSFTPDSAAAVKWSLFKHLLNSDNDDSGDLDFQVAANSAVLDQAGAVSIAPSSTNNDNHTTILNFTEATKAVTNVEVDSYTPTNLESETHLCCIERFANPLVEDTWYSHQRQQHAHSLLVSCAFMSFLCTLIIICSGEEIGSSIDSKDEQGAMCTMMHYILVGISMIGFGLLFLYVFFSDFRMLDKNVPLWPARTVYALCVIAAVGVELARPSVVGDDVGYFFFAALVVISFAGGALVETVLAHFALLVAHIICVVFYQPYGGLTVIYSVLASIVMIQSTVLKLQHNKKQFVDLVRSLEVLEEIRSRERLRGAVLNGLVPTQLHPRVNRATVATKSMDVWESSDALVMHMTIEDQLCLGGHTSGDFFSTSLSPKDLTNAVASLRQQTGTILNRIESAVLHCQNKTIDIIKFFGSSVIIAGPLDHSIPNASQEAAIRDVFEVVSSLFTFSSAARQQGRHSDSILTIPFSFSAAISSDQVISVLRLSEYPSYEVMGLGVNTARSLLAACPSQGMVVCTSAVADVYNRTVEEGLVLGSERVSAPQLPLLFADPQPWRIRGVGSRRIHRITPLETVAPNTPLSRAESFDSVASLIQREQ